MKYILYYNNYHEFWDRNVKVGEYAGLKEAKDASIVYENNIKKTLIKKAEDHRKDNPDYDLKQYFDNYWGLYFEIVCDNEEYPNPDVYRRNIYVNRYPAWERVVEDFMLYAVYRGEVAAVFSDDYGQCFYFKCRDRDGNIVTQSCGSYNPDFDTEIKSYIDYQLDEVYRYTEEKLLGARLRYQYEEDGERRLHVLYRMDDLGVIPSDLPLKRQIKLGKKALRRYRRSEPFRSEEKARKEKIKKGDTGAMYFSELAKTKKKTSKEQKDN